VSVRSAVPGTGGQEKRSGCEFGSFFSCVDGTTPGELLWHGIYSEIAVALKGGPWREASMAMLAMALGLSKEEAEALSAGQDILSGGMEVAERSLYHSLTKMTSGLGRAAVRRLSFDVATVLPPMRNTNLKSRATVSPKQISVSVEMIASESGHAAECSSVHDEETPTAIPIDAHSTPYELWEH
jgi:hypothetical protein